MFCSFQHFTSSLNTVLKCFTHFTGKDTLKQVRYKREPVNLYVSSDPSSPQLAQSPTKSRKLP